MVFYKSKKIIKSKKIKKKAAAEALLHWSETTIEKLIRYINLMPWWQKPVIALVRNTSVRNDLWVRILLANSFFSKSLLMIKSDFENWVKIPATARL